MLKVKLLRPLDGKAEGETAEYPELDAKRLEKRGVVKVIGNAAPAEPAGKEAPATENKAEPAPANKSAPRAPRKKAE